MAVRPIDLQTSISQIHEVGRGEQARSEAIVGQQHVLEKESGEKSRLVNTTMDETKKSGNATIQDQQKKENKKQGRGKEAQAREESAAGKKKDKRADDRMGHIIDVLK
jgi:hypothetical protein